MKVPMPAPQTAMPVAKARLSSKYMVTITMAGQYISPKPKPASGPSTVITANAIHELSDL